MGELAKKHAERLQELKKTAEDAQVYFQENVRRFEKFMRFVFKSSMTDEERGALVEIGKPTIEFNILEAYISRLRGEFAKQQPSLTVRAADGVPIAMLTREFTETIELMEAHFRSIFFDGANDMLDYNVYSDLLAGGFSVLRVYTEYVHEKSFEQNIYIDKVFDPTLTFFDPLARKSHKGDGRYAGEIYPMTKESFVEEFGEEAAKDMRFTRNLSGFNWSFRNETQEVVLVCDYYEKKMKKETILKLSNGHSLTKKEYEKFLVEWEQAGYVEQPPVVLKERKTQIETIVRYRFCETKVLDYLETDYSYLPLIFVDGNSVVLKESGSYTQMTRPYVYHAEGIQKLKNYAGQSLANELENTIQHKFVVAVESIPEEYQTPYQNVQKADVLMYNHFLEANNPNVTLPPPREVARTPIPPEITNTFRMSDEMTQAILGSYDNSAGVNQANLSGVAFARSTIQSNNASVPYVVGYIKGLNRVGQVILDLIPKYYRTPRSLPVMLPNGEKSFVEINRKGSLFMNFDPRNMQFRVEAGVNFAMQKEIALQTVTALSQSNKGFAQFFDEVGLPVILDNIEIRGIDQLKSKAEEWMQQQAQLRQQAQQQEQQKAQAEMAVFQKQLQSPTEAEAIAMGVQEKAKIDAANVAIKAKDSESKFIEVLSKVQNSQAEMEIKRAEVEAEQTRTAVDAAIKMAEASSPRDSE